MLTDNEIIKAYVNCIGVHQPTDCQECPYHHEEDGCYEKMTDDILDLINRQKAEIERLNKKIGEKEKLMEYLLDGAKVMENGAIEKTIKRFEDMLKDQFDRYGVDYTAYAIVDDVAKEMGVD